MWWRCLDGLSSCFQPLLASSQQEQPQLPGLGEALAWLPSEQETKQCGEAGGCSWQAGLFGFAAQRQELEPGPRQWGEDGEVQGVPGEKQGPVWVLPLSSGAALPRGAGSRGGGTGGPRLRQTWLVCWKRNLCPRNNQQHPHNGAHHTRCGCAGAKNRR